MYPRLDWLNVWLPRDYILYQVRSVGSLMKLYLSLLGYQLVQGDETSYKIINYYVNGCGPAKPGDVGTNYTTSL